MKDIYLKELEMNLKRFKIVSDEVEIIMQDYQEMFNLYDERETIDKKLDTYDLAEKIAENSEEYIDDIAKTSEFIMANAEEFIYNFTLDSEILKVNINLLHSDVSISTHNEKNIVIDGHELDRDFKYRLLYNSHNLELIEFKENESVQTNKNRNPKFKILLPKVDFEGIEVNVIKGDVFFEGIEEDLVEVNVINGKIEYKF